MDALSFAVRRIMRETSRAALGTLTAQGGKPYVSLVTTATDSAGAPLLLLSGLADHTRNIAADPRVSLLFDATAGYANPQQGPRVSLEGTAVPIDDPLVSRRFLARHPKAALYAGFGDFAFYRVIPSRAHWVGGFGKARWIQDELMLETALASAFALSETTLIERVNDEKELPRRLARGLLHARGKNWRATALDADGLDLTRGSTVLRLSFDAPLRDPSDLDSVLAEWLSRLDAVRPA